MSRQWVNNGKRKLHNDATLPWVWEAILPCFWESDLYKNNGDTIYYMQTRSACLFSPAVLCRLDWRLAFAPFTPQSAASGYLPEGLGENSQASQQEHPNGRTFSNARFAGAVSK
jgi:hypothetical protein